MCLGYSEVIIGSLPFTLIKANTVIITFGKNNSYLEATEALAYLEDTVCYIGKAKL